MTGFGFGGATVGAGVGTTVATTTGEEASAPSQSSSIPLSCTSTAPGWMAALASSQSTGRLEPSPSASSTFVRHDRDAGVPSTLPTVSLARTRSAWSPVIRSGVAYGLGQAANARPSMEQLIGRAGLRRGELELHAGRR